MRAPTSLSAPAAVAVLAAFVAGSLAGCATPHQSPIYQHSSASVVHQSQPTVQSASYTRPAPAPAISHPTITQPATAQPWASPTAERFAGSEGTPGFLAVSGEFDHSTPAPHPAPLSVQAPDASIQAVPGQTVPGQTVMDIRTLTISGPIVAAESLSGTQTRALMHRVQEGDTVYSLSRRYCTGVDTIRAVNGLDADYRIALGANLKVPSSCR